MYIRVAVELDNLFPIVVNNAALALRALIVVVAKFLALQPSITSCIGGKV